MVTISDITHWLLLSECGGAVGHILMCSDQGWHTTACRIWTPGGEVVEERPKRKCRKCMAAMKTISLKKGR